MQTLTYLRSIGRGLAPGALARHVLDVYIRDCLALPGNANEQIQQCFDEKTGAIAPVFPVNVFKLLSNFGVSYRFLPLDKLEGLYAPEHHNTVAAVGINSRRRYPTAIHGGP